VEFLLVSGAQAYLAFQRTANYGKASADKCMLLLEYGCMGNANFAHSGRWTDNAAQTLKNILTSLVYRRPLRRQTETPYINTISIWNQFYIKKSFVLFVRILIVSLLRVTRLSTLYPYIAGPSSPNRKPPTSIQSQFEINFT